MSFSPSLLLPPICLLPHGCQRAVNTDVCLNPFTRLSLSFSLSLSLSLSIYLLQSSSHFVSFSCYLLVTFSLSMCFSFADSHSLSLYLFLTFSVSFSFSIYFIFSVFRPHSLFSLSPCKSLVYIFLFISLSFCCPFLAKILANLKKQSRPK